MTEKEKGNVTVGEKEVSETISILRKAFPKEGEEGAEMNHRLMEMQKDIGGTLEGINNLKKDVKEIKGEIKDMKVNSKLDLLRTEENLRKDIIEVVNVAEKTRTWIIGLLSTITLALLIIVIELS